MNKAFLIRAGTFLLSFIPFGLARAMALAIADLCWLLLRERRRIVEDNLSHLVPGRGRREYRRLARSTFRNLALCSLDFLKLPLLSKEQIVALIELRGRENLDSALAQGKGAILVTAHLGNWDFAGAFLAALGYSIYTVAEDVEPEVYEVYERYRSATGMKILSLEHGALSAYRVLKKKEFLVLVGDRAIGTPGLPVAFCGGRRNLPEGPAAFALKAGAPLVIGYLTLQPKGSRRRYLGVVTPPLNPPGELGALDMPHLTQRISDRLSQGIQEHPDQWFVFQPQWIETKG
jgi:phosphatidylinositol dimannoside acyltransferase